MEEEWVTVATYAKGDEKALAEFKRWQEVALDLALYPESNVQLIKSGENEIAVQVSKDIHLYFQG